MARFNRRSRVIFMTLPLTESPLGDMVEVQASHKGRSQTLHKTIRYDLTLYAHNDPYRVVEPHVHSFIGRSVNTRLPKT